MTNTLLAASGEWFKVFLVIGGLFAGVILLSTLYSKIDEKTSVEKKTDGCGWPIFLVAVAVVIGIIINAKSCKGSGSGYKAAPSEWQYRHTD